MARRDPESVHFTASLLALLYRLSTLVRNDNEVLRSNHGISLRCRLHKLSPSLKILCEVDACAVPINGDLTLLVLHFVRIDGLVLLDNLPTLAVKDSASHLCQPRRGLRLADAALVLLQQLLRLQPEVLLALAVLQNLARPALLVLTQILQILPLLFRLHSRAELAPQARPVFSQEVLHLRFCVQQHFEFRVCLPKCAVLVNRLGNALAGRRLSCNVPTTASFTGISHQLLR